MTEDPLETTRGRILRRAHELTHGDRERDYGDPTENHQRIADLWSVVLQQTVYPDQVALCMVMVKVARLIETPTHEDSFIDGAAYLGIAGEIALKDR